MRILLLALVVGLAIGQHDPFQVDNRFLQFVQLGETGSTAAAETANTADTTDAAEACTSCDNGQCAGHRCLFQECNRDSSNDPWICVQRNEGPDANSCAWVDGPWQCENCNRKDNGSIICCKNCVLSPTPSPTPESTPSPTPEPTPNPTPEPTLAPVQASDPCEGITCSGNQVCVDGSCITSSAVGMLNAIAKFGTRADTTTAIAKFGTQATYESTTSTNFDFLFRCPANGLQEQQHFIWQGAVDYAREVVNRVIIEQNGQLVDAVDIWGADCALASQGDNCINAPSGWFECRGGCNPAAVEYPDPEFDNQIFYMEIYEPCNFVSNLAYYRVMPQVCGEYFHMNAEVSAAFNHAFGGLAVGSALFHGSQTYLGYRADVKFGDIVAFMNHQLIIGALGNVLSLDPNQGEFGQLFHLNDQPRSRTAIQTVYDVSEFIITKDVTEWAHEFDSVNLPSQDTSFTVIVATVVSLVYPEKPNVVTDVLNRIATILPGNTDMLNEYLETLLGIGLTLNRSGDQRFILFRQLLGMAFKMLYAFLWQENIIPYPYDDQQTNAQAALVMPTAYALFNFLTGFTHIDNSFQRFDGMYPGDSPCRATQPHAKWHELASNGLLDMIYMADCVGAIAAGSDRCAQMFSLSGLEIIEKGEMQEFFRNELLRIVPDFPGDTAALDIAAGLLTDQIFPLLNRNDDQQIDWNDIADIEDIVGFVEDLVNQILTLYQNFCTSDNNCDSSKYCDLLGLRGIPLQCQDKLGNGQTCTGNGSCQSGTCAAGVLGAVPAIICGDSCGDCNDGQWCASTFTPRICQTQRPGGYFPCVANAQCQSGQCAWYGECRHNDGTCDRDEFLELGICIPKFPNGAPCFGNHQCLSGSCTGTFFRTCASTERGDFAFCADLGCSQDTLNAAIQSICASQGCSADELNNRLNQGLGWINDVGLPFP